MVFIIVDPWDKPVGKYKIFNNVLKKGYQLQDTNYSSYSVYLVNGEIYKEYIGKIITYENGHSTCEFEYDGNRYNIYANGIAYWKTLPGRLGKYINTRDTFKKISKRRKTTHR